MDTTRNEETQAGAKHTRRPWAIRRGRDEVFRLPIVDDAGHYICAVTERSERAEAEANARLITAAPDFEAATAMWILIAGINGAVLPEDLEEWAKSISRGEKRTPVEAACDAINKALGND